MDVVDLQRGDYQDLDQLNAARPFVKAAYRITRVEDIGRGQTPISVKVKSPEIEHTVRIQDFERWLEANPRSPAEMILKNRLRKLLAKGS